MKRVLGWMTVVMLCCMAGSATAGTPADARLQEAQAALDEAVKLMGASRHPEALARAKHGLALREAVLGGEHPDVATSLHVIARIQVEQGRYGQIEPLLQRALAIREAALGKDHPDVGTSLHALASLYLEQSLYPRAEPLFQRALAIREAALGKDHPLVGLTLNALGSVYREQNLYSQAEPLFQRTRTLWEAAFGSNDNRIATPLRNLATIYEAQGRYGQAERLLQRALAINEASPGKPSLDTSMSIYQLAGLFAAQGKYGQAEPLFQRALALQEVDFGRNNPAVAYPLNALATLYAAQGRYGQAEPLLQRALALREAAFGRNNPDVATSLNAIANLYTDQGLYGQAEPLYQRALTLREAALGDNHPDVARTLNSIARLHLAQRRLVDALPLYTRAFAISEQHLRQETLDFSESRLASYLQYLREDEQVLYALSRAHPGDADVRRLALSAALLRKGRSVEETANISRTLYRSLGAEARDAFEALRGLRTRRATLSLAGPGALSPADHQQRLEALADEGDALEADLAQRSAPLRALTRLPGPAEIVGRVAAALPRDSALVEFIAYEDSPLVPRPGEPRANKPRQLRYLALVLFPAASTGVVDLGPAAPIDLAASRLRDALANRDAGFLAPAQALHQLAFQPLLPLLGDTRRLFLSPDGQLALVPFAALHDGHQFLVDAFDFTYVPSGTSLLPRPHDSAPPDSVVVLADPDFSAVPPAPLPSQEGASVLATRSLPEERILSMLRADPVSRAWAPAPLPGTRQEAESIKRLLPQAELFLGAAATKQRLLHLPPPSILHVATHGFFLEDAPAPPASRAVVHYGELGEDTQAPSLTDPLLRSGLMLAGAHARVASSPTPETALVTALELAGLDLWGTQLVVLSACDTGRGDVKLGQGVYGVHRAFLVAGAETVVMSLWKVSDAKTGALMEAYYRNLLAGQGRATALREAMRELRRAQPHPHYWAPFIAMGSDAPLRAPRLLPQQPPDSKSVHER